MHLLYNGDEDPEVNGAPLSRMELPAVYRVIVS
jgi:hypothetical protein